MMGTFFNRTTLLRRTLLLAVVMLTSLCVWAADITQNSAVVINSGNKAKYNNKSVTGTVPANSSAGSIGTFFSPGAIVVDGVELNLTIDGFNVDYSELYSMRSGISLINGATLHLTVKGTNTLKAGYGGAGISVPYGCTLEITATAVAVVQVLVLSVTTPTAIQMKVNCIPKVVAILPLMVAPSMHKVEHGTYTIQHVVALLVSVVARVVVLPRQIPNMVLKTSLIILLVTSQSMAVR